jgi:tRNA threonylcarbamoyladenosine biosynthesis protein TsaE
MKTVAASVEATRMTGAHLAAASRGGDCYALEGELGAGKTEFVRGFVASLDPRAVVKSPSFSILNIYETGRFPVYHFDFYRLRDSAELREIGFDEYASGDGVCLIEWGTLFPNDLPSHTKVIKFRDIGDGMREIDLP